MSYAPFFSVGHGFQMTFENGYTISVMWGDVNYCTNRNDGNKATSNTAEVAIFRPNGDTMPLDIFGDRVEAGHCTPDKVFKYISVAQSMD